jgi:hypothetical protein
MNFSENKFNKIFGFDRYFYIITFCKKIFMIKSKKIFTYYKKITGHTTGHRFNENKKGFSEKR